MFIWLPSALGTISALWFFLWLNQTMNPRGAPPVPTGLCYQGCNPNLGIPRCPQG